jgi:Tfp pilus assembly protein PilN
MIKINLLDSVTERNSGAVVAVERKIASPMSRLLMMTGAVAALLAAVIAWDVVSTQMAKTEAERQLAEQKQISTELAAVTKEMKELEQKIQNIDTRIETIKRLRGSQAGPSAVLEAMLERIKMVPGLYLENIEQKGEQLTITGNSPDESQVTQFGRSLEFSAGLFSNLNIETVRKDAPNQPAAAPVAPGTPDAPEPAKLEIVGFTIRCAYTPSKAGASKNSAPTSAANVPPASPASSNQAANLPPNNPAAQIAKN